MRVCNHRQAFNCELAVKAASFGYHRVSCVGQAVEYLAAYEGTARVLAGGQSLAPMLNMRLLRPDALIDINGIDELAEVRADGDTTVLGAMVRHAAVEYSPLIADRLAMMARVVRHIGDRQVRNRGTIGGSLAHGDPTGELPLACLALAASVRVTGPGGAREIPVANLYAGPYATVLDACEVITAVVFPTAPVFHAFAECCRRHNDFAIVSVACAGNLGPDGHWRDVRIALGGVADCPVLAEGAGQLLTDSELADGDIAAAAEAALAVIDPPDDIRASAAYRAHLVPVYVRRVLTQMRTTALAGSSKEGASNEVA